MKIILSLRETLEKNLDIETISGLSEEDASRKLNEEGFNELPSQKKQGIFPF